MKTREQLEEARREVCVRCSGTGRLRVRRGEITCPVCHGVGTTPSAKPVVEVDG